MAHFYGGVQGGRGKEVTRCGTKNTGYSTRACSWEGAVSVHLFYNEEKKEDWADVSLSTHHGHGRNIPLYRGPVSGRDFDEFVRT